MAREEDGGFGDGGADAWLDAGAFSPDDRLAADSARSRSRRRWLRQQAAESSTFAGALWALAENGSEVAVRCGPWAHSGHLRTVTASLCILELANGDVALLPTAAVTTIEAPGAVADDRSPVAGAGSGADLPGVLASLVGERPAVRLLLFDGSEVSGALLGLGTDAATVQLTSSVATVRLGAIAGCVLLARGTTNAAPASSGR